MSKWKNAPAWWLPWWLRQSRICLQCGRSVFNPWVGEIPWRRAWQPTPVFLPGEYPWTEEPGGLPTMGSQRVTYNWVTKHTHREIVEDRGAWRAAVHPVADQTWLIDWTTTAKLFKYFSSISTDLYHYRILQFFTIFLLSLLKRLWVNSGFSSCFFSFLFDYNSNNERRKWS